MQKSWLFSLCVLLLGGCNATIHSERAFYQWLSDPNHGLVQVRETGDVRLTARYLPPEWLAYRDARRAGGPIKPLYDSLLRHYRNSHTFLVNVAPTARSTSADVMYQGVSSYAEYKERVLQLNFRLNEFIHLDTGREKRAPVLHTLENTYSTTPGRNLYLVFDRPTRSEASGPGLDLVFSDEIFGSGINHFTFDAGALGGVPALAPGLFDPPQSSAP